MKIGLIGVGKMATALIGGLKTTPHDLILSGSSLERSQQLADELGLAYANSHQELIDQVDLIILGIKPQLFEEVLTPLTVTKPVISMAAGVTLDRMADLMGTDLPLIRIMPNMNAQILASTTGVCTNDLVSQDLLDRVLELTDSFGTSFVLKEKDFDTFTALAGSSPAYILLFIEALTKAGLKHGLPKDLAQAIVTQTLVATGQNLLACQSKPHQLIDQITSPGGTTIAGLLDLEETGLTASVVSSIDATIARAKDL